MPEQSRLAREPGLGLLVALLLAILAVRLVGLWLSNADLYFDEAQYWVWAQEPAFGYYTKPPLIAWLIAAGTSVCGDTPFCVRFPVPILHMASAFLVYAIALRLFDRRTAFFSALIYDLMPGLSLSSTLMSTDVPLLFFWSVGLLAIVHHVQRPSIAAGIVFGIAFGLGLNAKYAMIYLPLCFLAYAIFTREARSALLHRGSLIALILGLALIVPNVLWNGAHDFATFEHTRGNIGWGGRFPNIGGLLEFIGAQAAIIGPVPFAAFALVAVGAAGRMAASPRRLLLFHSLPVFLALVAQALISKANGNWAATAFPAAVILATAAMLSFEWRRGMVATFAISAVTLVALSFSGIAAGRFDAGPIGRELSKLSGFRELAANVRRVADAQGVGTVIFWARPLTASMIYELRDTPLTVKAYRAVPNHPWDHFELTRPWLATDAGPVILFMVGTPPPPPELAARARRLETFPTRTDIARHDNYVATAYRID